MGEQVMKSVDCQIPAAVWVRIVVQVHDRVTDIQAVTSSKYWWHKICMGWQFIHMDVERESQFCISFYGIDVVDSS